MTLGGNLDVNTCLDRTLHDRTLHHNNLYRKIQDGARLPEGSVFRFVDIIDAIDLTNFS